MSLAEDGAIAERSPAGARVGRGGASEAPRRAPWRMPRTARGTAAGDRERAWRLAGLAVAVATSAVLNTVKLSQNGYANIFYSAGVKSMLRSLHNLLFVSFDAGGLISIDKPPLGVWLQALSAGLFGFTPLSLLLPEAIAGVLAVAILYVLLARRLGTPAAFAGALALAVFPCYVAVSRDNGVDPLLLLTLVLACGAALRASETGGWRALLGCALLIGLAFNTKTLAAYLVVPGIALAYVVCAPLTLARRVLRLMVAGAVMIAVSSAWIAVVELTPASERPYVGSSTDNSELGLTFDYNGFGRVGGQPGGPGTVKVVPGAYVPRSQLLRSPASGSVGRTDRVPAAGSSSKPPPVPARGRPGAGTVRERNPIPFGGPPGALRLFGRGLGDQGGWMLPFALFGLLALAAVVVLERVPRGARGLRDSARRWRADGGGDPRLATLLVLGGWFVVEAIVLSSSNGIVHPYYVSGLAPGTGAMVGAGVVALAALARGRHRPLGLLLAIGAVAGTVAAEVVLMHQEHYMLWFVPALIAGTAVTLLVLVLTRRLVPGALALALALVLATPAAYASSTWLAPVEGTFPMAGPTHDAGVGGYGVPPSDVAINRALMRYVRSHHPGSRWALLTVASTTAAPMILMGLDAGAVAGYSGTDQALDAVGLARLVRRHEARFVLLGGNYSLRGGNGATKAVLRACRQLAPSAWSSPVAFPYGKVLFDCAGRATRLAR